MQVENAKIAVVATTLWQPWKDYQRLIFNNFILLPRNVTKYLLSFLKYRQREVVLHLR